MKTACGCVARVALPKQLPEKYKRRMMFDRHTKQLLIVLVLGLMLSSAHADLVGNWKFDDGAGDVATDKSGNGNHGTLVGG